MSALLKPRITRRPQLERETPIIAIAAARQVVEEVCRYLDHPLPTRYAARLAHRARAIYANSASFRARINTAGDIGRDRLYLYMRHWFAAILENDHPALYTQLPASFSIGAPLPNLVGPQSCCDRSETKGATRSRPYAPPTATSPTTPE